jgi:hypothetical protein
MVDARTPYVLVVKISDFSDSKDKLCAISKVALVVFVWLIFKLGFDLDDDLIWILSFISEINLIKSSF